MKVVGAVERILPGRIELRFRAGPSGALGLWDEFMKQQHAAICEWGNVALAFLQLVVGNRDSSADDNVVGIYRAQTTAGTP
jgi:hypothetical protein